MRSEDYMERDANDFAIKIYNIPYSLDLATAGIATN